VSEVLEVSEERRPEARVVAIRGELDLVGAGQLRGPLERAADDPGVPLVVDLSECDFIDSTGLATIVHVTKPLRDGGSPVTLVCPEGEVRKLFELAALDLTFPIADELADAL
jgi:anti-sigma B factor antagonist